MRGNKRLLSATVLFACLTAIPALAGPYTLNTFLAVPADAANVQPGGAFTSFDIGYVDPVTGNYYIADRSNAAVDIFSGSSLTFLGQAAGFTGQQATTSASGADGVLAVTTGGVSTLYAGDGDSTLKVFNVTNPAVPVLLASISTGGTFRADEMAYSPTANLLLVMNNADSPAFGTLINTTTNTVAVSHIAIPSAPAFGGFEQPVWNPGTGTFFVSVPVLTSSSGDPGGVAEISTAGVVLRTISFASLGIASCAPTGLALGSSGHLLVGCGNISQTIVLNPAGSGSIVTTIAAISGTDEVSFDPTTGDFFVTGKDSSGNRVFDIISDMTDSILQSILLPVSPLANAHSIAVDPLDGDVFVPLAGSTSAVPDPTCPLGCIAVYAVSVPEPDSLPIMLTGLGLLLGLGARRHWGNA
jgi:PEP-CTERM motif